MANIDPIHAIPKDKGWAWMCLLGGVLLKIILTGGVFKTFGVIFTTVETKYNSSAAIISWIPSVAIAIASVMGTFANGVASRYCARWVVITGAILVMAGLTLSSLASNIWMFFFTYGICIGVGAGLIFGPGLVVVNQYFEKRRGLANGVSQAGSGVGSMAIPPLILFALNNYGLEETLLIMGGLALNLCVCGMLFRPAKFYLRRYCLNMQRQLGLRNAVLNGKNGVAGVVNAGFDAKDICDAKKKTFDDPIIPQDTCLRNVESPLHIDERAAEPNGEGNGGQHLNPVALVHYTGIGTSFKNKYNAIDMDHSEKTDQLKVVISVIDIDCHSTNGDASTTAGVNEEKFRRESQPYKPPWFDFRLLTNPMFLIYAISIAISLCTYCDMFIMATPHAQDIGFSSTQATMVVSIMGVADMVGRIGFGIFADFNIIKKHHLFHASLAMTSVVLFVMPSLKTYGTYTFVCILFSSAGSVYMSIFPTLLVESFGIERFPTIYGMVMQFVACGHLIIPASMGKLRDITGSWGTSFYACGGIMAAATLLNFWMPLATEVGQSRLKRK